MFSTLFDKLAARAVPVVLVLVALGTFASPVRAQGLEFTGGWVHQTGNSGTDGFNLGAAWWFTHRVTLAFDYDSSWDTSSLANFSTTSVGLVSSKSHLQTWMGGPRIFFATKWTDKHKLTPFFEAEFGEANLNQKVSAPSIVTTTATDTGFTWMLGGGVDYLLSPHFSARGHLDFVRNHFANSGQSSLRLVLGIAYTFGSRKK